MITSLLLGVGAVCASAAALLRWRTRTAAGLVLAAALAMCSAIAWALDGREGLSDLALGVLIGLPVLLGSLLHHDRRRI